MGSNITILANDKQVDLVKKTVAKDLTSSEFNHFIHMARGWRLDPMRRQIYAIVYNKDNASKRRVTFVTGIDGYRAIADRTGQYRPGERSVECSDDAKCSEANPFGIISATASVFKRAGAEWHEYSETVYWEEYAPLNEEWAWNKEHKRKMPTGKQTLDTRGQWGKMGRVMLQKCAEAQALRRGWPDDLGSLYTADEMDQVACEMIDVTPEQQVDRANQAHRQELLGGPSISIDWCDGDPLEAVPVGRVADRILSFIREHNDDNPEKISLFDQRNKSGLRMLWAADDASGLAVNKALEVYKRAEAAE